MGSAPEPSRRSMLAIVAATSGGCLGLVSSGPETSKRVSVGTVTDVPDWMAFSVSVTRAASTTARPAVVAVSITNTDDEVREIGGLGDSFVSEYLRSGNANRLQLVPPTIAEQLERENPDCWKMDEPTGWGAGGGGRVRQDLEPGATIASEFEVWAHANQPADCIVPGTYEVSTYGDFELTVTELA